MDLLEKASIILTPTAYNNGEALCVKPSDGSGDFDFSRNSAATRVNAQGLVENVQILSSNLVQNGDFSEEGAEEVSNGSFSQEGSELVTNGDFSVSTGWFGLNADKVISDGKLNISQASGFTVVYQPETLIVGTYYKCVVEVSNYVDGSFEIGLAGSDAANTSPSINADGTFTFYLQRLSGGSNNVGFVFSGLANLSIDNFSVREVGQDWTLGTGWSIGEDKAISDGSVVGNSYLISTGDTLTIGKTYKVQYTVLDYISGQVKVTAGQATQSFVNADGTYTEYMVATSTESVRVQANSNFNGSITNISVKEVAQDWNLANVDFSLGAVYLDTSGDNVWQPFADVVGTLYKLTIVKSGSGILRLRTGFSGVDGTIRQIASDGIAYFTATANTNRIQFYGDTSNTPLTLNSVSVVAVTTDTNLPRINYEGFSYQDALGSELNPNTYIASKSANLTLNGTQLQIDNGGENYARARANVVLVSGKTYRAKVTCINQGTNGASFYVLSARPFGTINMISGETYEVTFVADSFYTPFYENKVGGSGLIVDNISIKEYLGQEVVPDSGCGSWLFEPQSTNLITQSELFSDASWTKTGSVLVSSNSVISPDGTLNGSTITGLTGSGSNDLRFRTSINPASTTYTSSVYLKGSGTIRIQMSNNVDNAGSSIVTLSSSWVRYEFTHTFNATTGSLALTLDDSGATATSYDVWGAQLEEQSYATSYIPTNGEANGVTRNQDLCNNGGSLASINSTEGVLYFEGAALANSVVIQRLSLSDGTNSNRVYLQNSTTNNQIFVSVVSGGVSSVNVSTTSYDITQFNKIAIKFKANDFALWINGIEVATDIDAVMPIGLNELAYDDGNGGLQYFGKTKALAVWKEALSDEELQSLTTI